MPRVTRPSSIIQLILPPAILSYLAWAWRTTSGAESKEYVGDGLGYHRLGLAYRIMARVLILCIVVILLRLYFLPKRFAVPPHNPVPAVARLETVFEVPAPATGRAYLVRHSDDRDELFPRCSKDKCRGGWKPGRARHCSECGLCRVGFDHHCLFVANCISAPILPCFLALLLWTAPTVLALGLPFAKNISRGILEAWRATATDPEAQAYLSWRWSWLVPAGPGARYVLATLLAWSNLDRTPAGADALLWRMDIGLLWIVGNLLALITAFLAYWQLSQGQKGELGNDGMRLRTYAKAANDVQKAHIDGREDPKAIAAMQRFALDKWFFVPLDHDEYAGAVVSVGPAEKPYDLGVAANFNLMFRRGRSYATWAMPWYVVWPGMSVAEASVWPLNDDVRQRLERDAARLLDTVAT